MAKNEKLKKLDAGETKDVSGGMYYYGGEENGLYKRYYVPDPKERKVITCVSKEDARKFASLCGVMGIGVKCRTDTEAYCKARERATRK